MASELIGTSDWRVDDELFDEELQYVQEVEAKPLTVRISGTQRKQIRAKPVVFYVIKSGKANVVERRYSDFAWLREAFKAIYAGMMLPPMPRKEFIQSEDVIEKRQRGLQAYLNHVLRNPYLRSDTVLRQFLRAEAAEWAAIRRRSPATVASNEAFQSSGGRRWHVLVESFHLEVDKPTVPTLTALRNETVELQRVAAIAATASEAMIPNLEQNEKLWRTLAKGVRQDNALTNRKYVVKYLPALKRMGVNLRLANISSTLARLPAITAQEAEGLRLLSRTLREDSEFLDCFKEVLDGFFVAVNCYREKRALFDKTEREHDHAREQLRFDQSAKLEPTVKRLKVECEQQKRIVHFHAKAILFSEAGRYSQRRFARLRLNLAKFAMLKCTSEQAAAEMWQDVIDLLDGDRDALAAGGLQNQETGDIDTLPYHPATDLLTNKRRQRMESGGAEANADGYDFEIEGSGQDDDSDDEDSHDEEEDVDMLQGALAAYYGTDAAVRSGGAEGDDDDDDDEEEEEALVDLL